MIIHYTQATDGRRAFARDERERRRLVSALVRKAGLWLLVFCLVDEHLHMALCGEGGLAHLVRDLRGILRRFRPDLELLPAHVKPVEDRPHLRSIVDYHLMQSTKHHLAGVHPALYSGSCFQDLVGVRLLAGFDVARLSAELPRLSQRALFPVVGLTAEPLVAATDEELHREGVARIAELAAATLGLGPGIAGKAPVIVRARGLAARLAVRLDFAPRDLARYVGVDVRSVQRLARDGPDDPRAEQALRRRLTLERRALAKPLGVG